MAQTSVVVGGGPPVGDRVRDSWTRVVPWIAAAVVVLGRLPHVASALGIDESGFLLVGGQWAPGGHSLYGDYFVDRPPLLISVFELASVLGGAVPLRLIGALAAAVAVLATSQAARRSAGTRAGVLAAVLVAALMVNPLAGTGEVNGELLASPLVALALACGVEVVVRSAERDRFTAALGAGACAAAATLVKQNMLDAWVFLLFLGLLTLRRTTGRRSGPAVVGLVLGATVTVVVTALWTVVHGTSLRGVFFAMYPFRWRAAHVLATTPTDAPGRRAVVLVGLAVVSGMVLLLAALLDGALRTWRAGRGSPPGERGPRAAVLLACVPTVAYGMASIAAGGSCWRHYLVELVVPLGLGAGLAVASWTPRPRRVLLGLLGASALVGALVWPPVQSSYGVRVGEAIKAVSAPTDGIVTVWGHSDVDYASGLRSPYPQLWSLTTRTLDPRLQTLAHTLESPDAPTWLVAWPHLTHSAVDTKLLRDAVAEHYRPAVRCPHWIVYERDGATDPAPDACPAPAR